MEQRKQQMGEDMSNGLSKLPPIVILGAVRSEGIYESTSYNTAKCLAKYTKVYYVENPYTVKDVWKDRRESHLKKRQKHFFSRKVLFKDGNLQVVVAPPILSIHFLSEGKFYRYLLRINERIISRRIGRILRKDGIKDYIFINSFNFHFPDIGNRLSPLLRIYQCVDPLIVAYDRRHGIFSEKKLIENSDFVVCTSKALYREKLQWHARTFFIPNAADIAHSRRALRSDLPISQKLQGFKKAIIGYIGSIERRLDYSLLKTVVHQNPTYDFVFAGPVAYEFVPDWVFTQPNLHLLGRVDYSELPHLLKGFEVCLIPFKKDEVSATIFPLKLFEYLGSGKPVVSTTFNPDLKEFTEDTVCYVDGPEAFSAAIARSIADDSEEKRQQRIRIAEKNTWDARAKTLIDLIGKFLAEKKI